MLDLRSSHRALESFHHRFQDDALPDALSRESFAKFDRSAYDASTLHRALGAWQARTLDEYRSQVAFVDLLGELTQLGSSFDIIGSAIRVVRDEARHVELCRRMVIALGGNDMVPGDPGFVNPDPRLSSQARVMRTLTGFLCIGETISMRLIVAVRDNTADPLARAVMTTLAGDESIHSSFGWALLEAVNGDLTESEKQDVSATLPKVFGGVEHAVKTSGSSGSKPKAPVNPFGFLSSEERLEIFAECVRKDVIPRFEALGYPGQKMWDERVQY